MTTTATRERPILFSGPMVRAILDGRKTQTRRLVKYVPALGDPDNWCQRAAEGEPTFERIIGDYRRFCPYGVPGDQLWVRETWQALTFGDYLPVSRVPASRDGLDVRYAATDNLHDLSADLRGYTYRPSIHMPRWASRITLEITDVRVERLQEITTRDAMREGAPIGSLSDHLKPEAMEALESLPIEKRATALRLAPKDAYRDDAPLPPRRWFAAAWDRLNGKRAPWASNPWVWVLTFRRIEP